MITQINEFILSNHYWKDSDNRFLKRVKEAKILNAFKNADLAESRFQRAMLSLGIGKMDNLDEKISPIAVVFGNLFFKEDGKIQKAELQTKEIDNGNVYVAIIKNSVAVTLMLMSGKLSNQELMDKINSSPQNVNAQMKKFLNLSSMTELDPKSSKRDQIVIDLDQSDDEFNRTFPKPTMKMNSLGSSNIGLSVQDIETLSRNTNKQKDQSSSFSMNLISQDKLPYMKDLIKEWTISEGQSILVPYPDGPREKKIKKIIVDDKGSTKKYSLEFENTLKPMELVQGSTKFIISPTTKNEKYRKLLQMFDLQDDQSINFEGKISSISYYKPDRFQDRKPRLGILISPNFFF